MKPKHPSTKTVMSLPIQSIVTIGRSFILHVTAIRSIVTIVHPSTNHNNKAWIQYATINLLTELNNYAWFVSCTTEVSIICFAKQEFVVNTNHRMSHTSNVYTVWVRAEFEQSPKLSSVQEAMTPCISIAALVNTKCSYIICSWSDTCKESIFQVRRSQWDSWAATGARPAETGLLLLLLMGVLHHYLELTSACPSMGIDTGKARS